ncbi:MAG: PadR family transcriptional regulator [Aggregatilineales bacterium]
MSHKYLVLGLLADQPMTGYDIKKHVETSLSAVTTVSYGTLYPTLHKLLREEAVEVQEVPQKNRPSKKVYHITRKGQNELADWLKTPTAADHLKREFLLKVYFAKDLPANDLRAMVIQRRKEVETLLQTLREEKDKDSNPWHKQVMDYTLSMCMAEIDWLDQLESKLNVA